MPDSCSLHALSLYHFFVFFQSSYFQSSSQLRTHRATFNARYCFAMLYSLTVIKHHHHSCFLSPSALFTSLIIYTQCFDLKISILIHSDIHRQCYTFFQFIGRDMFELSLMFIMICAITLPLNDCAIWDKITRHFDEFLYKTSTFFNYLDILLTFIFKRKYVWHYLKINKYKKINNSLKYGTLDSLCTVASRIVVKRNDTSAGKSLTSRQNMLT